MAIMDPPARCMVFSVGTLPAADRFITLKAPWPGTDILTHRGNKLAGVLEGHTMGHRVLPFAQIRVKLSLPYRLTMASSILTKIVSCGHARSQLCQVLPTLPHILITLAMCFCCSAAKAADPVATLE